MNCHKRPLKVLDHEQNPEVCNQTKM